MRGDTDALAAPLRIYVLGVLEHCLKAVPDFRCSPEANAPRRIMSLIRLVGSCVIESLAAPAGPPALDNAISPEGVNARRIEVRAIG